LGSDSTSARPADIAEENEKEEEGKETRIA
jgi:hypothetical protein